MLELERLHKYVKGQKPPRVAISIKAVCDNPEETLSKIWTIQQVVVEASGQDWPSDAWWEEKLPDWFLGSFCKSIESLLQDESLWDFGSWLDALQYRGWEWWSSELGEKSVWINIQGIEDPFVIGPLEYLIKVCDGYGVELAVGS